MILLKGQKVVEEIREEISKSLNPDSIPRLAIIRVGERADDISYEKSAVKNLTACGLDTKLYNYAEDISEEEFINHFNEINQSREIDGILLLRPLPEHIDESKIASLIDPDKDVDGISPVNMAKTFSFDDEGFAPCTAQAVMELISSYDIDLVGKNVVILGRSLVVGRALSMLMLRADATVSICHSKSKDIAALCKSADIIVSCIGKAGFVDDKFINPDSIVIDVGINFDENGKLCGDVDREKVEGKLAMLSPVPGGLGPVTTVVLAKHVLKSSLYQN